MSANVSIPDTPPPLKSADVLYGRPLWYDSVLILVCKEMLLTLSNLVRFSKNFFLLKAYENRQNLGAQLRTLRTQLHRPWYRIVSSF